MVVGVVVVMVAALCAMEGANVGSVNAKSSSRYDVIYETHTIVSKRDIENVFVTRNIK